MCVEVYISQKRAEDPFKVEFQVAMSHHEHSRKPKTLPSVRPISSLNHHFSSPILNAVLFKGGKCDHLSCCVGAIFLLSQSDSQLLLFTDIYVCV